MWIYQTLVIEWVFEIKISNNDILMSSVCVCVLSKSTFLSLTLIPRIGPFLCLEP